MWPNFCAARWPDVVAVMERDFAVSGSNLARGVFDELETTRE
jgi:hypothetical protein